MKTSQSPAPRPSVLLTLGPARGRAIAESPVSRPNKTMQNQIKPSHFAWFYLVLFVRIGTFQGLHGIQIKKILSRSQALSEASQPDIFSLFPANRQAARRLGSSNGNMYSTGFRFRPENASLPVAWQPDGSERLPGLVARPLTKRAGFQDPTSAISGRRSRNCIPHPCG
jgi:hypothetical protein